MSDDEIFPRMKKFWKIQKKLVKIPYCILKQYMLERVWRKGNPLTLLVGMQTTTATMENSVEIP